MIIATFIILPILYLIHEVGHCVFVKLMGGTVTNVSIGVGNKLFSIGRFQVNRIYFMGGQFWYTGLKKNSKIRRILIIAGGVIFNFLAVVLAIILFQGARGETEYWVITFCQMSLLFAILNLLPITVNGMNLDGKQIYETIRFGKSTLYPKKESK